jgi:hypothetical protein
MSHIHSAPHSVFELHEAFAGQVLANLKVTLPFRMPSLFSEFQVIHCSVFQALESEYFAKEYMKRNGAVGKVIQHADCCFSHYVVLMRAFPRLM